MTDSTMHDVARNRNVPYRLYQPAPLSGPHPVILVSHGLGGSVRGLSYLGRFLSQHGYFAVHLQHPGTDNSLKSGRAERAETVVAMRSAMSDPSTMRDRFLDVPFAVDELIRWNMSGQLAGHLDLERVGMAGNSLGAVSTLVAAGQRLGPRSQWSIKEPRIKAGLVISPREPARATDLSKTYGEIAIPLFHITGSEDGGVMPDRAAFDPIERTVPYEEIEGVEQYLLVLDGADHGAFSTHPDAGESEEGAPETRYTRAVQQGALLFFDAYLRGREAAKIQLRTIFEATLMPGDRFEWK